MILRPVLFVSAAISMGGTAPLHRAAAASPAPTATIAYAEELHALVEAHILWRGGRAFEALTAIEDAGMRDALGARVPFRRWVSVDGRSREELDYGPLQQTLVVSANPWQRLNGRFSEYDQASAEEQRRLLKLEFAAVLRGAGATVALGPPSMLSGATRATIRITFPDSRNAYDLLVDPQTGALHGMAVHSGGELTLVELSEWKFVGGVRMPFSRVQVEEDGSTSRMKFASIRFRRELPEDLFAKPELAEQTFFADGRNSSGPIGFRFLANRRIYLPARVNGTSVDVLLDSGAAWTVLDRRFAERLGIEPFGSRQTLGTGGAAASQYAAGVNVQIGNLHFNDLMVLILDLSDVEKRLGIPLPVILGRQAFDDLVVDLDFQRATIAFHEPASFTPPEGAIAIEFPEVEGHRAVHVLVEGDRPIPMVFDLGNGSIPASLYPQYYEHRGIDGDRPVVSTVGGAIGGAKPMRMTTLRTLEFAGTQFSEVPVTLHPRDQSTASSGFYLGNLGIAVLKRFRLFTDHRRDKLWVLPSAEAASAPFEKDRSGVSTRLTQDGLLITFVSPGSPAEAAGLASGEIITAIDSRSTLGLELGAIPSWNTMPAGTSVLLSFRDGSVRKLVLADYF